MSQLWVDFYVGWIDWKHNVHSVSCIHFLFCWFLPQSGSRSGECVIDIDMSKEQDEFLSGHAIDGRVLFPATGYLVSWSYINVMCSHIIRVERCSIWDWYQVITYLSFYFICIQYYMDHMRTLLLWDMSVCCRMFQDHVLVLHMGQHMVWKHCATNTQLQSLISEKNRILNCIC